MAKTSAKTVAMMLVLACITTMLVSTTSEEAASPEQATVVTTIPRSQLPGLLPPFKGAEKCWARLTNIPRCHSEIFNALINGQVDGISHACCDGVSQVTTDCWPKLFPFHPLFPASLKRFCSAPSPLDGYQFVGESDVIIVAPPPEVTKCAEAITHTEGCALEIHASLTTAHTHGFSPDCCKAINETVDKCWPRIFPFNPLLGSFLKEVCAVATQPLNS